MGRQEHDRVPEGAGVVYRVYPHRVLALSGIPVHLQSHERDVVAKRQVPDDELGQLRQPIRIGLLEHNTQLDRDIASLEGMRQRNHRVDRGGGWRYRRTAAQAVGVSSASR